jgi:hypothetical protein
MNVDAGADLARLPIRATTWRSLDRRLDWSWAHDATGAPVKSMVGSPMDFSATAARLVCPDVTLTEALIQLTPRAPRPAGTSETGWGAATPLGPEWVKLRLAFPLSFGQHSTRQRTLRLSVRYDCGPSSPVRAAAFGPSNSMLELRPTTPQDYPEWSGFARQREREWVTSGDRPRDKSGEPTHAHLRDWQ